MRNLMEILATGYREFTGGGQYLALYYLALLFFVLLPGKKKEHTQLFTFAIGMLFLLLFPGTAWLLLQYQTGFYGFSQLFLLLPIVPIIAWGMTTGIGQAFGYWRRQGEQSERVKKYLPQAEALIWLLGAAVIMLSGTVAFASAATNEKEQDYGVPGEVLEVLTFLEQEADLSPKIDLSQEILLAPEEVLEYARGYSGEFCLLYGRDLWNGALNAYSYDEYPAIYMEIHQWLNPSGEIMKVPNPPVVGDNFTVTGGFAAIEETSCSLLVLRKAQYQEDLIARTLEKNTDWQLLGETSQYVIFAREK